MKTVLISRNQTEFSSTSRRKFVGLVDVTPATDSQTTSKIDPPDAFVISKGSFVKGEAAMAKVSALRHERRPDFSLSSS